MFPRVECVSYMAQIIKIGITQIHVCCIFSRSSRSLDVTPRIRSDQHSQRSTRPSKVVGDGSFSNTVECVKFGIAGRRPSVRS